MEKVYISPQVEILRFLPLEKLANELEQLDEEMSYTEPVPDVTIPGNKVPGWGN